MASKTFKPIDVCKHVRFNMSEKVYICYAHLGFSVTHRGRNARICNECYLPQPWEWTDHLMECESCFGQFSAPTGEYCKRCSVFEEEEFIGWEAYRDLFVKLVIEKGFEAFEPAGI